MFDAPLPTEAGTPAHPALSDEARETLHLVNRLRLDFRTHSSLELEAAVNESRKAATSEAREKILAAARQILGGE